MKRKDFANSTMGTNTSRDGRRGVERKFDSLCLGWTIVAFNNFIIFSFRF